MNFSSFTFKRWVMPSLLILFNFSSCSAADFKIPSQRDPGGIVSHSVPETPKHALPTVSSSHGQQILSSYTGSYALLIGESEYTNGWSTLENIPSELDQVEEVLIKQGFHVEKSLNLNAEQLRTRFRVFINDYGFLVKAFITSYETNNIFIGEALKCNLLM